MTGEIGSPGGIAWVEPEGRTSLGYAEHSMGLTSLLGDRGVRYRGRATSLLLAVNGPMVVGVEGAFLSDGTGSGSLR